MSAVSILGTMWPTGFLDIMHRVQKEQFPQVVETFEARRGPGEAIGDGGVFPALQAFRLDDKAFRGERRNEVMAVMAKPLTDDEIANLAAWFASIKVQAQVPN